MDIKVCTDFTEKSNSFDFSVLILGMSLQTTACHYGSHKDISYITDDLTDTKYDP